MKRKSYMIAFIAFVIAAIGLIGPYLLEYVYGFCAENINLLAKNVLSLVTMLYVVVILLLVNDNQGSGMFWRISASAMVVVAFSFWMAPSIQGWMTEILAMTWLRAHFAILAFIAGGIFSVAYAMDAWKVKKVNNAK